MQKRAAEHPVPRPAFISDGLPVMRQVALAFPRREVRLWPPEDDIGMEHRGPLEETAVSACHDAFRVRFQDLAVGG